MKTEQGRLLRIHKSCFIPISRLLAQLNRIELKALPWQTMTVFQAFQNELLHENKTLVLHPDGTVAILHYINVPDPNNVYNRELMIQTAVGNYSSDDELGFYNPPAKLPTPNNVL